MDLLCNRCASQLKHWVSRMQMQFVNFSIASNYRCGSKEDFIYRMKKIIKAAISLRASAWDSNDVFCALPFVVPYQYPAPSCDGIHKPSTRPTTISGSVFGIDDSTAIPHECHDKQHQRHIEKVHLHTAGTLLVVRCSVFECEVGIFEPRSASSFWYCIRASWSRYLLRCQFTVLITSATSSVVALSILELYYADMAIPASGPPNAVAIVGAIPSSVFSSYSYMHSRVSTVLVAFLWLIMLGITLRLFSTCNRKPICSQGMTWSTSCFTQLIRT